MKTFKKIVAQCLCLSFLLVQFSFVIQKKLKLIFYLAFLQKSQLYLSESEFRIMKFDNSHIIPDL